MGENTSHALRLRGCLPDDERVLERDGSERHRDMFAEASDRLYKSTRHIQDIVAQFETQLDESDAFVIAWLLLDEAERKRHLFQGMKETCLDVSSHYDGRALCPEITTTAMLKQNGKAFIDFSRDLVNASKETGPDNVYLLPSEWWSSAVSMPEPWPEDIKFVFTQLSLQRNEFIGMHTNALYLMPFAHDMLITQVISSSTL